MTNNKKTLSILMSSLPNLNTPLAGMSCSGRMAGFHRRSQKVIDIQ